ncbi:hypothetical protein AAFA46_02595 [Oscillospiraceae bacterium WX1]
MTKNKLVIITLIITSLLMISGCKKLGTVASSITSDIETYTTPAFAPASEQNNTLDELSMEAYENFMKNETKVSFDRYMPEDYVEGAFYKKGSEYTLSEILKIVTANYFKYSSNKKIKNIEYSYIDCGNDGVKELVLRLKGMDIYCEGDDSTLVYVIKYISGKLSLCYYYETWARCDTTMNEYGYYQSVGSGGASLHDDEYGLIDKDGNWHFIVSIESELDINQLSCSDELKQIPELAKIKGITDRIEFDTIRFYNNLETDIDQTANKQCFYTFYVYDDNTNQIKDGNLYTKSLYKEIFDEAKVPFITPDKLSTLISEKEINVGATPEIKEGTEIKWNVLSGNIFSDYVG